MDQMQTALTAFRCLDLTSLNDNDTAADIAGFSQGASIGGNHVAALCVYPQFVAAAHQALSDQFAYHAALPVGIATVVLFPYGKGASFSDMKEEIHRAFEDGATEIDMVFDHASFLKGRSGQARAYELVEAVQEIMAGSDKPTAKLKVILETGVFDNLSDLVRAADGVARLRPDFLKTSTGKVPEGATLHKTRVLLEAIRDEYRRTGYLIGLKISGKVSTVAQVQAHLTQAQEIFGEGWFAAPHTFRIGASGILSDIREIMGVSRQNTKVPELSY